MQEQQTTLASVANIADARKAKKDAAKRSPVVLPMVRHLDNTHFEVSACDGQQSYIWLAKKLKGGFKVQEIFPGLTKKRTRVRDAKEAIDLVLKGLYRDEQDVLEELDDALFGDEEEEEEEDEDEVDDDSPAEVEPPTSTQD